MILSGRLVVLRPAEAADLPRLAAILREPAVERRWGRMTDAQIAEEYTGNETSFAIVVDDQVVGSIQFGEEEEPMYRHANIDIFLTTARHRQGLGTDALRTLARYLFEERGHHRLMIDPAADNAPAIEAYARLGFRPVGIMRSYERGLDGTWHDGLLMDLLAGELVEEA